jgi:CMP-N,N'-diacetyllegionaminic acid synthase
VNKNILITICARGGSKGIKKKNIKLLNGKPLIFYTIDIAQKFSNVFKSDIALSTDDDEIIYTASKFGLTTKYVRPKNLAEDHIGKLDTIEHLLKYEENSKNKKYDIILDLDVTSPLRNLNDLTEAYNIFNNNSEALNLFSVGNSQKNPYFNMVELKKDGFAKLVKKGNFLTRQSSPKVYSLNASFYYYKRSFFNIKNKTVVNNQSLIYDVKHVCFDLDETIDFDFMNFLISENKLNFKF